MPNSFIIRKMGVLQIFIIFISQHYHYHYHLHSLFSLHTHLCAFASLLDTSCNTSHRTSGLTKLCVLFNYEVLYFLVEYACGWIQWVVLWSVVVLLVSKFQSSRLLVFSEDLFFLYLLSPFIFNAGYAFSLFLCVCVCVKCKQLLRIGLYLNLGSSGVEFGKRGFLYFGTIFCGLDLGSLIGISFSNFYIGEIKQYPMLS